MNLSISLGRSNLGSSRLSETSSQVCVSFEKRISSSRYYDSHFVLIMNDVSKKDYEDIVEGVVQRTKYKMPEIPIYVGIGSRVYDIANLYIAYQRAKSAAIVAKKKKTPIVHFDNMGIHRLLYSVADVSLLSEMGDMALKPLLDYDAKHNSNYVETLEWFPLFLSKSKE